ncbi:MAG: ATP-binding cassette domain-containing protein [Elusimicrobiota bacterium]
MMTAIDVKNLSHTYKGKRSKSDQQALNQIHFQVKEGSIFGLVGPNGGGKTTLFKILSTALKPTSGNALIFGLDLSSQSDEIRKKIGVVFQSPSLDKKLTVIENIIHQGRLYGLNHETIRRKSDQLLTQFSLRDRREDFVETLSGGLQRRVEIAKGLLHNPSLLLLDEPSTGLDPGARHDLWELLLSLKNKGVTILVTTHLMEEAEKCDELLILNKGRCITQGTPLELKNKIGADIITVQTADPQKLAKEVNQKFPVKSSVVDGVFRIEIQEGHKFVPTLVEAFPGMIAAISVGKPTLEDVFVKETGHTFHQQEKEI